MSGAQIISKVKLLFPHPSLWDYTIGIAIILAYMSHFLIGQLELEIIKPYRCILYGILAPFALALFRQHIQEAQKSLKILAGGIGFLFSQFVTIGDSFSLRNDWSFCFENWQAVLIWTIETLCYGYVFYIMALGFLSVLQNHSSIRAPYRLNLRNWFLIILSVKLIFFIALFPCVFDIDAAIGLRSFLDPDSAICDHHPFLVQWLHGISYLFGQSLGSPSLGFALLSLVFVFVSSGILIYGLALLGQANLGRKWTIAAALIFAFFPLFPYLNLLITKDGLFAYFFLLYLFTIYELYLTQGNCLKNPRFIALHTAAILFVCLTRHQGIYLVILEFFLLLFCYKNYWKRISAMTIPALILYFCYSNILLPSLNVEPSGKQEIYGTLFHQTARCLNEYPNEETESERKAIDAIFDRDIIIQNYSYDLTDGSKDCYKYNPMIFTSINTPVYFRHINRSNESQELEAYRSAWLSMFLRHPLSCIQATLGVCIGFFFNNDDPLVKVEPHWATARFAITPKYEFWHFRIFEYIYYKVAYHLARIPVICWIFAIPYYIWVAIIALSLLLYRKDLVGISIFLPVILSLGLLLVCPFASGRYAFPIVVALPLLIIYLISSNNKEKCQA